MLVSTLLVGNSFSHAAWHERRPSHEKRFMLSITEEMQKALEKELKKRMRGTIPETARVILGEYLARSEN